MDKITSLKGMKDYFKEDLLILNFIKDSFINFYSSLGYQLVKTPLIEYEALFNRSLGEETDVVKKEMFTFFTKSKKKVVLRPENTASIIRFIFEKKLQQEKNLNFFYFEPMFRYERPQKNRYRQFFQVGCETFKEKNSYFDASLLINLNSFLKFIGISDYKIAINCLPEKENLKNYQLAIKNYFKNYLKNLCTDCHLRIEKNPLRILDCKIDNWKEFFNFAPESLNFCSKESQEYFFEITKILKNHHLDFFIDKKLVRGLDYYNDLIFEVKNEETTLVAGGRYNHLFFNLYQIFLPGIGFSIGCERLLEIIKVNQEKNLNFQNYKLKHTKPKVYFLVLEDNLVPLFLKIYEKFLKLNQDFNFSFEFFWTFKKEKLNKALTFALKNDFSFLITYGNKNFEEKNVTIKKIVFQLNGKINDNYHLSLDDLDSFFKKQ